MQAKPVDGLLEQSFAPKSYGYLLSSTNGEKHRLYTLVRIQIATTTTNNYNCECVFQREYNQQSQQSKEKKQKHE
jgi:hypothetical protein